MQSKTATPRLDLIFGTPPLYGPHDIGTIWYKNVFCLFHVSLTPEHKLQDTSFRHGWILSTQNTAEITVGIQLKFAECIMGSRVSLLLAKLRAIVLPCCEEAEHELGLTHSLETSSSPVILESLYCALGDFGVWFIPASSKAWERSVMASRNSGQCGVSSPPSTQMIWSF